MTKQDAVPAAPSGAGGQDDPDGGLVRALAAAQARFPSIPKTKTAEVISQKGSYRYNYADLADVLAAVRPVLAEQGLAITQRTIREDRGNVLLTELRHVGGGTLTSEVELAQSPGNHQQFGGALTYLRRYELTTLLGIHADEDTDGQHVEPVNGHAPPQTVSLPAWALEASAERKRELVDSLAVFIGRPGALGLAKGIAASHVGYVPDIAVALARSLRSAYLDTPSGEVAIWRGEALAARQGGAAAAQDAAAERPDDPPPASDAPEDPDVAADEALELMAERPDEPPPPGTVDVPDLPKDPAVAFATLRAAGCVCDDPLAQRHEQPTLADDCPIAGHGVPFT